MEQHVSVSHMQNDADVSNDELVLENSKDIIYISDPNTHELVYMNRAARKASQLPLEGTDYVGRKCYEVIQKKDKPCEFCTNSKLKKNQNYIWCHNNKAVNAKYVLKDSLVIWNGKKCRMEVAMDISDDNKIAGIVAERMEVEDALTECIWRITSDVNFKTSYIKFLETLGSFYGAKRACIIMYDETDGIYEWKSSNLNYLGDKLSIFSKEVVNEELRLRNKGGIVEDILIYGHGEGVYSNNQGIMSFVNDNRIWSMYATPILDDKKEVIGITVIFNPQKHLGDIRILNMLSAYVAKAYANRNR
jgi:hypothetical protein